LNNHLRGTSWILNTKIKGDIKEAQQSFQRSRKKTDPRLAPKRKRTNSAEAWRMLSKVRNTRNVGYNTVIKDVKTLGKWVIPNLKTIISTKNKQKRIEHCEKYLGFDFLRVMFTDETSFEINRNSSSLLLSRINHFHSDLNTTQIIPKCWAEISCEGKTEIHFVEGWIDGEKYQEVLQCF